MRYFKDENEKVRAIDAGQEFLIQDVWQEMTEAEVEAHIAAPPVFKTQFTSLEYLDRFTQDEQEAIVGATYSNVQIKLYYDRLLAATFIDLDDPRTEAGIDALIAAELLAPDRKAALMQPEEIANV